MTSSSAPGNPPPPRSSRAQPRRLYRDPHGPIGGVASGFAEYFDVDPVIARLLWVVALLSGIGLPAYVLCWLIVPKAPSWPPPGYVGRPSGGAAQPATWLSGIVIIGLAALVGSGLHGVGDYLLPAALIGFGIYLLNQRPVAAAPASSGGLGDATMDPNADPNADPSVTPGAEPGSRPAVAPRGIVTPTVLSVLGIAAGVLVALSASGVAHVSVATAAAIGLAIVGAGLIASLWLGRARGLVPVGLGLIVVLLSATVLERWVGKARALNVGDHIHVAVQDAEATGIGDRKYVITSLDDLDRRYEVGIGAVVLDLSQLDLAGQERSVDVEVGIGKLSVIMPSGASVDVHGALGAGKASVLGRDYEGVDLSIDQHDPGLGAGTLHLDLEIGLGEAQARRAP